MAGKARASVAVQGREARIGRRASVAVQGREARIGRRASVNVFGSINTDLVVYLPRLPYPGETISGGSFASFPGGKGANSAVAAARAGAPVRMFGAVGADSFGEERLESLAREGIDTSGIVKKRGAHSGIAQIWVDARGENSIAVAPGANALYAAEDVSDLPAPEDALAVAAFQNEIPQPVTEALLRRAKGLGYRTVWNLAPQCANLPDASTLAATDYVIVNENEIRAVAALLQGGRSDAPGPDRERVGAPGAVRDLAGSLLAAGARNVIVTLGRAGSVWVDAAHTVEHGAFPVEAVDTVGAGDCYCGVFAATLASGAGPEVAMRRASAAAAISVTRKGAQTSMPLAKEIEAFLAARG